MPILPVDEICIWMAGNLYLDGGKPLAASNWAVLPWNLTRIVLVRALKRRMAETEA